MTNLTRCPVMVGMGVLAGFQVPFVYRIKVGDI